MGDLHSLISELNLIGAFHSKDAFTSRELKDAVGFGEHKACDLIRAGIQAGKLRAVRKTITDIAGRPQTVPAYEFIRQDANHESPRKVSRNKLR